MPNWKNAFVDAADMATLAVKTLINPNAHAGAQYAPTGPQSLTVSKIACEVRYNLGWLRVARGRARLMDHRTRKPKNRTLERLHGFPCGLERNDSKRSLNG